MEIMFILVPLFIAGVFIFIITMIITQACKSYTEWEHNNRQPVLSVPAVVRGKRTATGGGANNTAVSTWYYVTFELESGVRMEFGMKGREYGLLAEGDRGTLTYQGTRYHGFERMSGSEGTRREYPERDAGGDRMRRTEG